MKSSKLSLRQALGWIALATLCVSGSATLGVLYYRSIRERQANDDAYRVVALIQSTPHPETLKTVYLAELLNLSQDRPTNLYCFNAREAQRKLLAHPVIQSAKVFKIRPGTIHVDYALRQPVAFLLDYTNTALDAEGFSFPFHPFFTPKRLPEIYFGIAQNPDETFSGGAWGTQIQGKKAEIALELLETWSKHYCSERTHLKRIDLSRTQRLSCGKKQIIVVVEEHVECEEGGHSVLCVFPFILRLGCEDYLQGLANYAVLRESLMRQRMDIVDITDETPAVLQRPVTVVDLRLPQLAFYR